MAKTRRASRSRTARTARTTRRSGEGQQPQQEERLSLRAYRDEQQRLIQAARDAAPPAPEGFITLVANRNADPWTPLTVRITDISSIEPESNSDFEEPERVLYRSHVVVNARGYRVVETPAEIAALMGCAPLRSSQRALFLRFEHPLSTPERPVECYASADSSVRISDTLRAGQDARVPDSPEATIMFGNGRLLRHRGTAREIWKMYEAATGSTLLNPPQVDPVVSTSTAEEQAGDAPQNPRGASRSGLVAEEAPSAAPLPHPAMESCQEDGPVAAQPVIGASEAVPDQAADTPAAEGTDAGAATVVESKAGVPAVVRATGQRVRVLRTVTDSGGRGYAECEVLDDAGVAVDVNEFFVDELDPSPAADAQPPAHTAAEAA